MAGGAGSVAGCRARVGSWGGEWAAVAASGVAACAVLSGGVGRVPAATASGGAAPAGGGAAASPAGNWAAVKAIDKHPQELLYFNLAFYDGPKLMKINEWGVRFRTYFLKTPFGDQGLCIKKDIFSQLGKYPEDVACGEDHLLVRQARRKNIKLMRIKSKIYTSGRKYEANGWVKTTILHLYLSVKQAHEDNKEHRRA